MSRVIKFRAKNLQGEWCYGYFCKDYSGTAYITTLDGIDTYTVDESTLGQYTGLTDVEDNEIYEDDLLDFDENEWGGKFIPEVITMYNIVGEWNYAGSLSDLKSWRKVVGNIYDNPELLENGN